MSDKSFGDHINKSIVKNPLLSSAVTGLSLEDLTHKAVLLPATPTQGQVTRLDQQLGSQSRTLAKADDDKPGFPFGDAFSNIPLSNTPTNRLPNVLDSQNNEKSRGTVPATQSKTSVKSEDDFDVNEYIARLQGTRYVSAPLHSHKKEDKNANLDAEESLEEINLNESGTTEPVEVQQSLTADIAQNFSQLPTVLPHVASAVFSSFSNMLNMNKSREQTPDEAKASGYQDVQFERPDVGVPLMGVEEASPKDIGLPPTEPPLGSIGSYRITSKKKYAQIPGLSSGGANVPYSGQNMSYNTQNVSYNAPIQQVIPPFFTPANVSSTTNVTGTNEIKGGDNSTGSQHVPLFIPAEDKMESNANMTGCTDLSTRQLADTSSYMFNPVASKNNLSVQASTYNIANTENKDDKTVLFNIDKAEIVQAHENRPLFAPPGQQNLLTSIENKQGASQGVQPGPPIIPPPPMFSNIPKKDNQSSVGKSVLPPSVARRISSNQPLIKPQALPTSSFTENIFVPLAVPETSDQTSVNQEVLPPTLPQSITFKSDEPVKPLNIQPSQDNVSIPVIEKPGVFPLPPQSRLHSTGSLFMPPKQEVPQSTCEQTGSASIPPAHTSVNSSALPPKAIPPASQFELDTFSSSTLPIVTTTPSFVPMFSFTSQNMPLSSTFPSQGHSTQDVLHPITQYPPDVNPEPAKPIVEPPKAIGNLNFRMIKKRPQYYSGPIEGIGDISNYVKPTIQPVMPPVPTLDASNKAAFFNPGQQLETTPNNDQSSMPFDISRPVNPITPQVAVEPQTYTHIETLKNEPYDVQEYKTAFDLSRPTTEAFDPPKQESKGFGIIGSLKSKLSSIDINKIQSTVTTFFDPAYNESKGGPAQAAVPFVPQQYGQYTQEQSNFGVTIPSAEQSQCNQFGYQNVGYNYDQRNQYYQSQNTYASSYFSDPNYVQKTYDDPSLNKNTQESISTNYTQDNIPQNVEKISITGEANRELTTFYNPATMQEHDALKIETDVNNSRLSYDKAIDSTFVCDSSLIASINPQAGAEQAYKHLINPLVQTSNFLDNPVVAAGDSKIKAIGDGARKPSKNVQADKLYGKIPLNTQLAPAISFFDKPIASAIDSTPKTDDLVDNMNKLALAEEIAIANSPFQAVDFAIGVIVQPKAIDTSVVLSKVVGEKIVHTTAYENIVGSNTDIENKLIKDTKGSSLMETLSKSDIPVVAVSSMPLFGLSAVIADKSKELLTEEKDHKCLTLLDSGKDHSRPRLEKQASFSFFDDVTPDKNILEESLKTATKTHLSITDVKNVLLIEPPQENLGTILKRNASSSVLKDLPEAINKGEQNLSEDRDSSWNLDAAIVTSKHNVNVSFDKKGSVFFDHLFPLENPTVGIVQSKNTETMEQESDFNICETCREVNVPEDKETDNVTTQLIENINSSIQLKNPVEASLTETDPAPDEASDHSNDIIDDITHITENTFDTLQAQSAANLLKDVTDASNNYEWTTEQLAYSSIAAIDKEFEIVCATSSADYGFNVENKYNTADREYTFKIDPNTIGFFGDNQLFFNDVPKNASDEIKAEFKTTHDDIVLPKQMSLPSAPPAEDDTKSDEACCLDVHSIEQDAKNDFPIEEEFIIEPSKTDDDKIEFRERKRSSDDSTNDTFADRIEKFKNKVGPDSSENIFEQKSAHTSFMDTNPPKSMASYFDTGNYAVETHYRNSLTSPTIINTFQQGSSLRIPPGFEDEYKRRLSAFSASFSQHIETYVPETSTQTQTTLTPTFTSADEDKFNVETEAEQNLTEASHVTGLAQAFFSAHTPSNEDQTQVIGVQSLTPPKAVEHKNLQENVPLQDPIHFFSANTEEPQPATSEAPENFSRLASYFSMPPAQPDHSKSFFELSQSQNHYRHDKPDSAKSDQNLIVTQTHHFDYQTNANLQNLMSDLTSTRNMKHADNIVRTINHFSVEYDDNSLLNLDNKNLGKTSENLNLNLDSSHVENNKVIDSSIDSSIDIKDEDIVIVKKCEYCCNKNIINTKDFNVRTAVNDTDTTKQSESNMNDKDSNEKKKSVSVDLGLGNDVDQEEQDGTTVLEESRPSSEYTPVRHHWFYRVDVDDKSLWRGFSAVDSNTLEHAYLSPDLNEDTLVPTDGGRFDVNIIGRLRIAVYWKEKPTNVRRCSWFYKGNTDARYVPYTEAVADKLEEEYRHGVTTGEWHRRLVLPNSELVVMHGPAVMVHFLHGGAADSFSSPPFILGKRVYRNPPKIRVARDQPRNIDHLIFMVHGAGEYKRSDSPSTSRPRVVRRGCEEYEIEDPEPSSIDHLLLLCHGVGSACDMRFRSVEEVVEDFRTTSLQLVQSHYRNSYDNGIVSRVEVLPISWHAQLHVGEDGVDKRLNRVTLDSIPRLRAFTNHTVLDALFYTSPVYHQTIIDTVCFELNRIYGLFKKRNPNFKGGVSLGGHSLGSVILYDLLCHQNPQESAKQSSAEKTYLPRTDERVKALKYPQLQFPPAALYALGSPIAIFECIRGVESLGMDFALPTCKNFFNIFHPYDPIAYRIEPLINPLLQNAKPFLIPHHKGRKRMHLELKDTMVRVGADLKQKLLESLRTTWNKWKSTPPPDGQLEKVVEEELEKEQLCDEIKDEDVSEQMTTPDMLGKLNNGRRVDYVLQEAPLEMINEYLFAMSSHVGYWESEDTMLLMLREIYSSLGVEPDSTVPQQSMTVQRARVQKQNEATIVNEKEYPSTSRGSC